MKGHNDVSSNESIHTDFVLGVEKVDVTVKMLLDVDSRFTNRGGQQGRLIRLTGRRLWQVADSELSEEKNRLGGWSIKASKGIPSDFSRPPELREPPNDCSEE
ncbi:MAG: hypothetical protein JXM79_08160 [Sedimentisphaerales bacterium]|nr:hypothetical protein [Sedimentisphaerales bacterium]